LLREGERDRAGERERERKKERERDRERGRRKGGVGRREKKRGEVEGWTQEEAEKE